MMTKTYEEPSDATAFEAVLFDLRVPSMSKRVHRARANYQEESDIEFLDEDHAVVLIRPGRIWRQA
jgi:hypothetical protein